MKKIILTTLYTLIILPALGMEGPAPAGTVKVETNDNKQFILTSTEAKLIPTIQNVIQDFETIPTEAIPLPKVDEESFSIILDIIRSVIKRVTSRLGSKFFDTYTLADIPATVREVVYDTTIDFSGKLYIPGSWQQPKFTQALNRLAKVMHTADDLQIDTVLDALAAIWVKENMENAQSKAQELGVRSDIITHYIDMHRREDCSIADIKLKGWPHIITEGTTIKIDNKNVVSLAGIQLLNKTTTEINLSHNRINTIPASSFIGFIKLIILDLSNNQLAEVPESLAKLKQLEILSLENNPITTLSAAIVTSLGNLQKLFLYNTQLKTLPIDALATLKELQFIDVTRTPLDDVTKERMRHVLQVGRQQKGLKRVKISILVNL